MVARRGPFYPNGQTDFTAIYPLLLLAAYLNAVYADALFVMKRDGFLIGLLSGGGINPILIFTAAWCIRTVWREGVPPLRNSGLEILVVIAAVALIYVPLDWFSWMAVALIGGRIAFSNMPLGVLCVYSSVPPFWGLIPLKLVGVPILEADAYFASLIAGYGVEGNLILPSDGGEPLSIYWSCSSFHGITYMILAWLAFSTFRKASAGKHLQFLLLGIVGVVVINWTRLILMVRSQEQFESLHMGTGSQIVAMITLLWIVSMAHTGTAQAKAT